MSRSMKREACSGVVRVPSPVPEFTRQICKDWDDDFDGGAFCLVDPGSVRAGE